jgi:uncharacterized protein
MDVQEYLAGSRIKIWAETFSLLKATSVPQKFFAVIRDEMELTVIVNENEIDPSIVIAEEKNWRLLTFDTVLPFELVGFLAVVAEALAREGISIVSISSYSTDHILVKEKNLKKSISTLEQLGCIIINN